MCQPIKGRRYKRLKSKYVTNSPIKIPPNHTLNTELNYLVRNIWQLPSSFSAPCWLLEVWCSNNVVGHINELTVLKVGPG